LKFYQFSNLQTFLPHLGSITEFISSEDYLAHIKFEVSGTSEQIKNLSRDEQLAVSVKVLESISNVLEADRLR
jgi:type III restriction enzyme